MRILVGDARDRLAELPDQSVQCCVTSPPYWGLRDYGHDGQIGLEQLRSDIIWAKPNPMPESVTDRPTSAFEHVFLLTKAARYHYDAEAIKEKAVSDHPSGNGFVRPERLTSRHTNDEQWDDVGGKRNKRNVWTIPSQPFPGAHFAVMPAALVEPCIKAGAPRGSVVLDPFAGAGTVGLVASRLGRDFIGVELNPEYAAMARDRIVGDAPLLTTCALEFPAPMPRGH